MKIFFQKTGCAEYLNRNPRQTLQGNTPPAHFRISKNHAGSKINYCLCGVLNNKTQILSSCHPPLISDCQLN